MGFGVGGGGSSISYLQLCIVDLQHTLFGGGRGGGGPEPAPILDGIPDENEVRNPCQRNL